MTQTGDDPTNSVLANIRGVRDALERASRVR